MNKVITPPSQGKVEISEDGIYWTCKCGWRSTFLDLKCPGCGNGQPAIYAAITQALCESEAITACSNQRFDTVTESSGQTDPEAAAILRTLGCVPDSTDLSETDAKVSVGFLRRLIESSGQGTDGAEAMREAAAEAIENAVRDNTEGTFDALGTDVGWATGSCNFTFDESYFKGHQPVPINFNSLARIVDKNCLRMAAVIRALLLPVSADGKLDHRSDCQLYTVPTYGLCTCDFDQRKAAQIKSKQPSDTGAGA